MSGPASWRFGSFELDAVERRLLREGKVVPMPPKAFDILTVLLRNPGRLVKRQDLFDAVWSGVEVEDANLTNNVTALRRVLGRHAIVSVPRYGYRFCLPVSASVGLPAESALAFSEAQTLLAERSTESVLRSRDLLWLVVAQEPQCASAWAWLGRASRFLEKFGVQRPYHRKLTDLAFQRAFAIDPELAWAHQFFTVVQVDRGEALHALQRLLRVVEEGRADAHCFAALVQVCRFCGLSRASVEAHKRVMELNAGVATSVPHTYFARCEYEAVVESYLASGQGGRIYLDLCAWACLGFTARAEAEALRRLQSREWPPLFKALLDSLVSALRGDAAAVRRICSAQELYEDPESALYLSRHLAFSGCHQDALRLLECALAGGLAVPEMLEGDPWLAGLKPLGEFKSLVQRARDLQRQAQQIFGSAEASQIVCASLKPPDKAR